MLLARRHFFKILLISLAFAVSLSGSVRAADLETGVIVLQPMHASIEEQNEIIGQLRAKGVHLIRTAMRPEKAYIDFARRAFANGIRIDALVDPQAPRGLPPTNLSNDFRNNWTLLASADPNLSRTFLQNLIQQLEANGVVLAAIELGNEINWTDVNKDFPRTIRGKILDLDGLRTDPVGQQFAANFTKYLNILAVVKDVRDHSSLNKRTPIISAGLVSINTGDADTQFFESHGYSVTIGATLKYLQAGGLDKLVDYYGVHYYPRDPTPAARKRHLEISGMSECRAAGSATGKPCWITEWGADNTQKTCPVNDMARAALIQETMDNYRELARADRLLVALYYSWNSPPGSDNLNPSSIYRCGELTDGGKRAISP